MKKAIAVPVHVPVWRVRHVALAAEERCQGIRGTHCFRRCIHELRFPKLLTCISRQTLM